MTSPSFHLRRDRPADVTPPRPPAGDVRLEFRGRITPGAARDLQSPPDVVAADELVRITYSDGSQWWQRADDLLRERGVKQAVRGFEGGLWDIDTRLDPLTGAGGPVERGVAGTVVKVLDFFGVELDAGVAKAAGKRLEERALKRAPGLYRLSLADAADPKEPGPALVPFPGPVGAGVPVLIFLHGTFSSLQGSYGELWDPAGGPEGQALRAALAQRFGDQVYAFEHRTLTQSPVRNALELARHLPAGAQLHLVSHSRGGLVGELLCLAQRKRAPDPLVGDALKALFKTHEAAAAALGLDDLGGKEADEREAAHKADRQALAELIDLLDRQKPVVRRFARVACPANGTTLASGRIDRWLNLIHLLLPDNLIGDSLEFLFSVLKNKTDPRTLPGLEAMMPGSALTQLLRAAGLETEADLSVIAGDVDALLQADGVAVRHQTVRRLALRAADRFFASEHDFVVNARSMLGGLRRSAGRARYNLDRGLDVSHFSYFRNRRSLAWLQQALLRGDDEATSFRPLDATDDTLPPLRTLLLQRGGGAGNEDARRPLAVLVPGTMGSVLQAQGETVWLHYLRLLRGQIDRIGIDRGDVLPIDLVTDFYGPLAQHLQRTHQVHLLPYDWRLSITEAAVRLRTKLQALLPVARANGQPIHIVAHSMGGLVARAMMADTRGGGAEVWRQVCALPGSRLLMLGTPNRGSHEAVRWLTGFNPTQIKLSLLDFTRSTYGLTEIVQAFPGLLELLPSADPTHDFADIATWQRLHAQVGQGWPLADAARLREARVTWKMLAGQAVDPERVVYVAGCQPQTVAGFEVVSDDVESGRQPRLAWKASAEGDGTVLWSSGRLEGVPMYYAPDTAHDELCSSTRDPRLFRGYVELLLTGRTEQLAQQPPTTLRRDAAGGEPALFDLQEPPPVDSLPDESDLRGLGFGARPRRRGRSRPGVTAPVIQVGITHGNLAFAQHPVLVGHYLGDTIVSAEKALDDRLHGELSRRIALGLYPGRIGSHAVFQNAGQRSPSQALVIGLGQVGELSPGLLETGVRDLLLDLALRKLQERDARPTSPGEPRPLLHVRLSSLLVGTGAGALKPRDSMEAILRGAVAANRKLAAASLDGEVQVDCIEFLELYEDIALGAAQALDQLLRSQDLRPHVNWTSGVLRDGDGRLQRRRFDEDPSWWQRLEIVQDEKADRSGQLRFIATTDRARAEETLGSGQLALADQFVATASSTAKCDPEVAKTLFEMLIPRRLKETAPEQRDMVLLVDRASARFPWELLEDRWSQNGRPIAVAGGLVRQFKTPEFRIKPMHASEKTVFIVGDPDLADWAEVSQLPGARAEAWAVSRQFEEAGYRSLACVGEDAQAIMTGLHSAAWRVLHLAGHGVHEYVPATDGLKAAIPPRSHSGMVIGRNTFLTPGDVEQLRYVPELVFVNCCHLGQTRSLDSSDFNRLAANLGAQFIAMGVKAVVAAGWAVDDTAALTFAQRFYECLLGGETFGVAVREARALTWERHPGANTWGAYQCYGDPAFRLSLAPPERGPQAPRRFYAPAELIAELGNLRETVRARSHEVGGTAIGDTEVHGRIEALLERIPADQKAGWTCRADVAAALGFVWGEQGDFEKAVHWLEEALRSDRGDCPIRVVEQCANFRIRLAAMRWQKLRGMAARAPAGAAAAPRGRRRSGTAAAKSAMKSAARSATDAGGAAGTGADPRADARGVIEDCLRELDLICQRAETPERLNLLASACKRLAWVCDDDSAARHEALVNMQAYSQRAFDLGRQGPGGEFSVYSFTNLAVAGLLIEGPHADAQGALRLDLRSRCAAGIAHIQQEDGPSHNIWRATGLGDLAVVQLLIDRPDQPDDARAQVALATDGYRLAFQRAASPRERSSVLEQLDFLADLLAAGWPAATRDAVVQIRESL